MTNYGYIRLRKDQQHQQLARYKNKDLKKVAEKNIHFDVATDSEERPAFQNLIQNILQKGDALYIPRFCQVGKSLFDFLKLQQELNSRGILLVVVEFPWSEDDDFQKKLQDTLVTMSIREKQQRLNRQKNGLERAKRDGRFNQRRTKVTKEEVERINKLREDNKSGIEISKQLGYSPTTIYRILNHDFNYPLP